MSLPQHSIYRSTNVDLNQHIIDQLQPVEDFNRLYKWATDVLASFLREQSGFRVAETVKGGSLGKGTAIRGHCDLDLVLFLNGYPTVQNFSQALPGIVNQLAGVVRRWSAEGFNVAVLRITDRILCLTMNRTGSPTYRIRVDIVPAFARRDATTLYREMVAVNAADRAYYSSSLARQQVGFVIDRPASLKNLIRLVKSWRKTHLRENQAGMPKIPKSFALELVTIHVWESCGSPLSFSVERMFKTTLLKLVNYRSIDASWTAYYTAGERAIYSQGTRVLSKPFILDPANPFHNVGDDFDWQEMAQMAAATAGSPRLSWVNGY